MNNYACIALDDNICNAFHSFRVVYRDLTAVDDNLSPSKREFQLKMAKSLMSNGEFKDRKVLNFQSKDNNESDVSFHSTFLIFRELEII